MRILYLGSSGQLGGTERALLDMLAATRQVRPDWSLALLVPDNGPLVSRTQALGVDVEVLPFPPPLARLGDSVLPLHRGPGTRLRFMGHAAGSGLAALSYARQLRRALARFQPDVVHSHGLKMHVLAACVRPERSAVIWHLHDYVGERPISRRLLRRLRRRCHLVVANSASVASDARAHLGGDVEVRTVHNVVNLARFSPEGPRLDLDELAGLPPAAAGTVRVGLVATFARWKGHLTFIDAIKRLIDRPLRAYILGGPIYETAGSQYTPDELRASVQRAGLDGLVGFTGFVEDTAAAMRALDVVVHASTHPEPFGLTIAEGMAAGRAVVVSYAGGAAELVVPERDALAHRAADADDLARQIRRLIEDASLRTRLGCAARAAALDRFNPARLATELMDVYAPFQRSAAA